LATGVYSLKSIHNHLLLRATDDSVNWDGDSSRENTSFKIVPALNGQAGAVSFEVTDKPGFYLRQRAHRESIPDLQRMFADRFDGSDSNKMVQINVAVAVFYCDPFCFVCLSFVFLFGLGCGGGLGGT
jgi:hypothetical protein